MKICEYEDIRCPYCGKKKVLKEVKPTQVDEFANHEIVCLECLGIFWIVCED